MQTRRQFVRAAGTTGIGMLFAPQALASSLSRIPELRGGTFDQGVLSGDPTPRSAVLWTHVGDVGHTGLVRFEVAKDKGFRHVVTSGAAPADAASGYSVKLAVQGLKPGERYYYRFATKTKHSPVGRFQTALPADSRETVRFAVISCQEYTLGYFNAHALLAREDVDFVINTGDYIYGDVAWPAGIGVRTDPQQEARTVEQYRAKYALYRSDPNLRKVHANFPFIDLWDDHEVQNNYAGGAPDGGSEIGTPFSQARKEAAYKAWFDVMPTYPYGARTRLYHKAGFGKTMDLFVLDERQYRSSQPCGKGPFPDCPDANGDVTFLGAAQQAFFLQALQSSKANWKVVANELMIMGRRNADGQLPDTDSWQGYLRDREAVLAACKQVGDVVFVTGDVHEFIAGEVHNAAGEAAATEFVGTSITAASDNELAIIVGDHEFGPDLAHVAEPPDHKAARLAHNPEWRYLDADHHGYMICEAGPTQFKATFKPVSTIRTKSTEALSPQTFTVNRGTPALS